MAKAVLARENIKELSNDNITGALTSLIAKPAPLTKDLFLCDCPRNGRYNEREDQKSKYLAKGILHK